MQPPVQPECNCHSGTPENDATLRATPARGAAKPARASKHKAGYQPPDLKYSHEEARRRPPSLTPGHRGIFAYWLEAYEDNGWGREEAERRAFAKALGGGPVRLKEAGIWRDFPEEGTA